MPESQLPPDFFSQALSDNSALLAVRADALITAAFADQSVVASNGLEIEHFARLGHCELAPDAPPVPLKYRYWGGEDCDRLFTEYEQVVWRATWQDHSLRVVHLRWETSCGGGSRDWVVAESVEIADEFILDIERKTHAPGEAILVFAEGHWRRSAGLYQATQAASFDDLILADDLKQTIRNDFQMFLESEDRYARLGVAWRRGALLIGPPGNGKTHCVRALVKELEIPSLYVQSLSHAYFTSDQLWKQIFERARGLRPCVLVLEDLDTLVTEEDRSFFLNQLDGFERNHGLIVLATTNYPERIDSAIIDRPSRFDRKYHFQLPSLTERTAYLGTWQDRLADETGWAAEEIEPIAAATDGFSFAYLKELIISAVMKWMDEEQVPFVEVLGQLTQTLGSQMQTESSPRKADEDQPGAGNGRPDRVSS